MNKILTKNEIAMMILCLYSTFVLTFLNLLFKMCLIIVKLDYHPSPFRRQGRNTFSHTSSKYKQILKLYVK
jgi:hypothetical protein